MIDSLRILETSVERFPPLKAAVGGFIGCLDIVQKAASNRADYGELADEFQSMTNMLAQYAGNLESEPNIGSIANIAQSIRRQVTKIKEREGTIGHLLDTTQDQEDVIRCYRGVGRLFLQLQYDLSMRTRNDVQKQLELSLLDRMLPVGDARYNSGYSDRRRCTAKTREAIQQALQDWSTNPNGEKIYWMNGMAGTGKTTIAYSFCEWLEDTNRLGASFFCSRISSTCRSLSQIVPTIAYQLARFSPAYRSKLCATLNNSPDAGKLNVVQQFEKLINQPMLNAKDAIPDSVVIVIDALDECDDYYSVRLLLNVLLKFAEHLPLKFFVASRPDPVIRDQMISQGGSSRFIVYLHDIEQSIVEEDIKKYFTEALGPMEPAPSLAQIELLAKRSRSLFIYAAMVVRYIHPDDASVDHSARLELMLEAIGSAKTMSSNKYEELDLLYTTVLNAMFETLREEGDEECMHDVLRTVICAREPVTTVTIASLARLTEDQVRSALHSLRSVVHVSENSNLISILHASFLEYMLDSSRSKKFYCDESESNETMAHRCFDIMNWQLRFNICQLDSSYLTDDQVDDLEARVTRAISPALSYACRYWASHLQVAPPSDGTHYMIFNFLSKLLLFWMEVLSLSRCIGIGAPMMQQAQTWLRQMVNNRDEIQKQVSDARSFVTWFAANPCSRSTPHIYISALPLSAKSSWYDEAMLASWTAGSRIYSVTISPEGDRIANGCDDGGVHVYDIHTGTLTAGPFQGHTSAVSSVAFSPDGREIASGSHDNTVIVWDALTGRIVAGPLDKHVGAVKSVAFSPDGQRVASGSDDRAVIVWDYYTSGTILGPLEGHSGQIISVAFSPDGQLIASGSIDESIMLWDASAGTAVTKLIGHKGPVLSVAFSPDNTCLASGSGDKTARVWDARTGTLIGQPLERHISAILSVAFSPDGNRLATTGSSDDNSIIIWDIPTGSVLAGPFRGHTDSVNSAIFSPDATRVISCSSDGSIRIWDTKMRGVAAPQRQNREISIGPIAFSPDYSRFISNSSLGALRVWDLHTGSIISPPFELQTDFQTIRAVAFSPDGTHVAASTNDFIIRMWDAVTGKEFLQPFKGHTDKIGCVLFSPDGTLLCSGSDDATIRLWDIYTGVANCLPCDEHTSSVHSIAYSPNGTCIVSGSADAIVRVWDLSRSTIIHILRGHTGPVESVAFSPNGRILVSGGLDGTIQKWDIDDNASYTYGIFFEQHRESSQSETDSNADSFTISPRRSGIKVSNTVNHLSFSAGSTRMAAGFDDGIRIFDVETRDIIRFLPTPGNEVVRRVGFSSVEDSIVSASATRNYGLQIFMKQPPHKSPKSPNIIHVWRAGEDNWSQQNDGRIIDKDGRFILWLPFDLGEKLELVHPRPAHLDIRALLFDNFFEFGYQRRQLCIGTRWSECYVHSD
ncbi:Vegetative incompatibility protein HET-E-1 [Podospora anserina] [Rhizoctonia solani]|uniref:Vegetative incompatibility protein HET-E-1 [Podospora anserina] n=1 Tax=Rhizoctonia solani TaxID=456999 RepID=A0A0K6GB34_9AGAM|nr:Vegetative incompatibility protein HET-E-1 [Podospora anserina] [Rhizoctonia solani]